MNPGTYINKFEGRFDTRHEIHGGSFELSLFAILPFRRYLLVRNCRSETQIQTETKTPAGRIAQFRMHTGLS